MINDYGKGAVVQISTVFQRVTMLLVEGSSGAGLYGHLSNHIFRSPSDQKSISYEVIFFLKMWKIQFRLPKCNKIWKKNFFFSEIIASEDVAINCLY